MKRKILTIALTGIFVLGLIASINTNQTNQEKNIEILQNSHAEMGPDKVGCTFPGRKNCPNFPDYNKEKFKIEELPAHFIPSDI